MKIVLLSMLSILSSGLFLQSCSKYSSNFRTNHEKVATNHQDGFHLDDSLYKVANLVSVFKSKNKDRFYTQEINLISIHPRYTLGDKILNARPIQAADPKCKTDKDEKNCFQKNANKSVNTQTLVKNKTNSSPKFLLVEVTGAAAKNNNHRQPGLYFVSNTKGLENDADELDLIGVQSVLYGNCILRDTNSSLWHEKLNDRNCLFNIHSDSKFYKILGTVEDKASGSEIISEDMWFEPILRGPGGNGRIGSVGPEGIVAPSKSVEKRYYIKNYCVKSLLVRKMLSEPNLSENNLDDYTYYNCSYDGYFFDKIAQQVNSLPKGWLIYQAAAKVSIGFVMLATGSGVFGTIIGAALEAAGAGFAAMAGTYIEEIVSFLGYSSEFATAAASFASASTSSALSLLSGPGLVATFLFKDSLNYSKCTTDKCKVDSSVAMAVDAFFLGFEAYKFDVGKLPKINKETDPLLTEKNEKINKYLEAIEDAETGDGGMCLNGGLGLTCNGGAGFEDSISLDTSASVKNAASFQAYHSEWNPILESGRSAELQYLEFDMVPEERQADIRNQVRYFQDVELEDREVKISETPLKYKFNNKVKEGKHLYIMTKDGTIRFIPDPETAVSRPVHSQLASGEPISAGGEVWLNSNGEIIKINNSTGHYRVPPEATKQILEELENQGYSGDIEVENHTYQDGNLSVSSQTINPSNFESDLTSSGIFDVVHSPAKTRQETPGGFIIENDQGKYRIHNSEGELIYSRYHGDGRMEINWTDEVTETYSGQSPHSTRSILLPKDPNPMWQQINDGSKVVLSSGTKVTLVDSSGSIVLEYNDGYKVEITLNRTVHITEVGSRNSATFYPDGSELAD